MSYKYTIKDKYGKSFIKYGVNETMDYENHILTIAIDNTEVELCMDVHTFEKIESELPPATFYNNEDRYGSDEF